MTEPSDPDGPPPSAGVRFFKGHGLGNDYLVFEAGTAWPLTRHAVRCVCERWEGVGSDGLVLELPPRGALRRLRMFNPDGSEFERSGNGLRVYAAYLASSGLPDTDPFPVEVGGGRVSLQVHDRTQRGEFDVSVDMGRAEIGPGAVALDPAALDDEGRLLLPEGPVAVHPVSVGNPHCVVLQDDISDVALERLGPVLSTNPAFAHGTNVQLARPDGPSSLRIRIWERGVGRTRTSGTSACAASVAAVAAGRLPPGRVDVLMDGGRFRVDVSTDLGVRLRGPVQETCTGTLSEGFVRALREAR